MYTIFRLSVVVNNKVNKNINSFKFIPNSVSLSKLHPEVIELCFRKIFVSNEEKGVPSSWAKGVSMTSAMKCCVNEVKSVKSMLGQ